MHDYCIISMLLISVVTSAGCGSREKSSRPSPTTQPAHIDRAQFDGPHGDNARKNIIVDGWFFKTNGEDLADLQTRTPDHPVQSQRQWRNATAITRSRMQYKATIQHSAADSRVEVRIRGEDDNYSVP